MDVINPPIIVVGNRRYRVYPSNLSSNEDYKLFHQHTEENICSSDDIRDDTFTMSDNETVECAENDSCNLQNINIKETSHGFTLDLDVPSAYYKDIIGKKGDKKRQLEADTKTNIKVPYAGTRGCIVITGQQRSHVISAKDKIEIIVASHRRFQASTHFVAFPLNYESIQKHFETFMHEVLDSCSNDHGVDRGIFQDPKKFHLTLGMMALLCEKDKVEAEENLKSCYDNYVRGVINKSNGLNVHVKGLEYMNDDPSNVDVLYAKVTCKDGSDLLQSIGDHIVNQFIKAGIITDDRNRVKLHLTVMRSASTNTSSDRKRKSFNASNIMKHFGEYDFGHCRITRIDICQRGATQKDGYYYLTYSLPIS